MGKGQKQTSLQGVQANGQQSHEKMLITNYYVNVNQKHNDITLHLTEWLSLKNEQISDGEDVETFSVRLYIGVAIMKNSMKISQKIKNRAARLTNNSILGIYLKKTKKNLIQK